MSRISSISSLQSPPPAHRRTVPQRMLYGDTYYAANTPSVQRLSAGTLLKFGQKAISGKNGVFFTVEYQLPGALNGGLGIVSDYIPRSLNEHHGKDVRVIMPATSAMATHIFDKSNKLINGWEDTQETITLEVPWKNQPGYTGSKTLTFRIYQNYMKDRHTWLYNLVSWDKVLQDINKTRPNGKGIDTGEYQSVSGTKKFYEAYGQRLNHGGVQLALLCNQAMAEAARRLDPTKYTKSATSQLQQADGKVDFWITNDWMTGNIANLPQATQDIGQVFIVHNLYDKDISVKPSQEAKVGFFRRTWNGFVNLLKRVANWISLGWLAKKYGWNFSKATPPESKPANAFDLEKVYGLKGGASLLNASLKGADSVVVNEEFLKTMRDTDLLPLRSQQDVQGTLKKIEADRFFDMHHGAAPEYHPVNNPVLAEKRPVNIKLLHAQGWNAVANGDHLQWETATNERGPIGFAPLPEGTIPKQDGKGVQPTDAQRMTLQNWKQQNKLALQKLLGLTQDSKAILYCWTNRLDPYQKLTHLVLEEMQAFMKREPRAQFVIWQPYDGTDSHINKALLALQKDFPGRFIHAMYDSDGQILLGAGASFALLPSMYEPYGIAQLQASQLGALPIASDVDGLHSTVSDPERNTGRTVPVWDYGQTGILIKNTNPALVQKMHAEMNGNPKATLTPAVQKIKQQLQENLRDALDRSVKLAEDEQKYYTAVFNGMRFINVEHDWKKITERYKAPLQKALQRAKARSNSEAAVKTSQQVST